MVPTVVAHYGGKANLGGGKPWERKQVNHNGKPVKIAMHVKKGDIVQVIAGSDKGTVAEVEKVLPAKGMIVVKGVNVKTRNVKPRTKEEQGQQKKVESLIHHSNVMHYSTTQQTRSRVGIKVTDDGRKVRFLKKTGEELPERSFKLAAPADDSSSGSSESTGSSSAGGDSSA